MDANLKQKWVEALRSGEYEQTQAALFEERAGKRGFCCLGVLCDVLGTKWENNEEQGVLNGERVRARGGSYLSPPVLEIAGFDDECQRFLAAKNDRGASFAEIADYIEERL